LVLIPLHAPGQTNLLAAAQLVLDGRGMAREFARLDRKLFQRALAGFLLAGAILAAALVGVFRRLQQINRRLQEQAVSLRRANQELALAAKTSALGAVTAHLMHGLTSPFAGLHNFVAAHAAADDAESQDALRSAQRMQAMIEETVRVLNDGNGGIHYELPLAEMVEILSDRTRALATATGVRYESVLLTDAMLSNRAANLVALILENLLRNAIQATPEGKTVCLTIKRNQSGLACEVADEGEGLSEALRQDLFAPCRSTKPGGNGIGLAISQQLARHLGAELKLVRSSAAGCVFALALPDELFTKVDAREVSPIADLATAK
jgi:signal transduction histidine kinase